MSDNCEEYYYQQQAYANWLQWQAEDAAFYSQMMQLPGGERFVPYQYSPPDPYASWGILEQRLAQDAAYNSSVTAIANATGLSVAEVGSALSPEQFAQLTAEDINQIVGIMVYERDWLYTAAICGYDTSGITWSYSLNSNGSINATATLPTVTIGYQVSGTPPAGGASAPSAVQLQTEIKQALVEWMGDLTNLRNQAQSVYADSAEVAELNRQIAWTQKTLTAVTTVLNGGTASGLTFNADGAFATVSTRATASTSAPVVDGVSVVNTNFDLNVIGAYYSTGDVAPTALGYVRDLLPGYAGIKQLIQHESAHARVDTNSNPGGVPFDVSRDPVTGLPSTPQAQADAWWREYSADSRALTQSNGNVYFP